MFKSKAAYVTPYIICYIPVEAALKSVQPLRLEQTDRETKIIIIIIHYEITKKCFSFIYLYIIYYYIIIIIKTRFVPLLGKGQRLPAPLPFITVGIN